MRKFIIIVIVLLAAGLAVWLWWKSPDSSGTKKKAVELITPEVSLVTLNITDIDDERIKLTSRITINNPFPVDIHAGRLSYKIYIDSIKVIEDRYNKPLDILSSDSSVIELPMEILAEPLMQVMKHFKDTKADSADYMLSASVDIDVPIAGERTFNIKLKRRGPAIYVPEIKLLDVDLNALRLKKKGIDMSIDIQNPNSFPLQINDANITFTIPEDLEVNAVPDSIIDIPAHGSKIISIHADIKKVKILKTGWDLIADRKDTPFKYVLKGKIVSDNDALNNSPIRMTAKGTLDEIMKVRKKITESN
ncbi:MAG TPA: LEA type 2 family protein [Bacteroidia bacterium]|nr:LEA type 2 family protein [Bacteroidia bacterium]